MSIEQDVLVELTQFNDHLATVANRRHLKNDKDCVAYHHLVNRGQSLLPLLLDFQYAISDRAFAPIIGGIVGSRFDVPDAVFDSDEKTREYCITWLQTHVQTS